MVALSIHGYLTLNILFVITLLHVYMKAEKKVNNWQVQVIKRVSLH